MATKALAIYSYTPQKSSELPLIKGEVLEILDSSDEKGWWEARKNNNIGWVPYNYVCMFGDQNNTTPGKPDILEDQRTKMNFNSKFAMFEEASSRKEKKPPPLARKPLRKVYKKELFNEDFVDDEGDNIVESTSNRLGMLGMLEVPLNNESKPTVRVKPERREQHLYSDDDDFDMFPDYFGRKQHNMDSESLLKRERIPSAETPEVKKKPEVSSKLSKFTQLFKPKQQKKKVNILILGETGVGKSTWINGIVNYNTYETLEEAMNDDTLMVTIPFKFLYTDLNGASTKIEFGMDPNEIRAIGDSATQFPREYNIETETTEFCLIDTPGIGDSRGILKDKENFENILAFLCNYDRIHAVIVLVKPNVSRLTVAFRFCVLELLTHLHKSLVTNIIFAFTNSRATFYRPGDSFPVLKQLLEDHNINIPLKPPRYFCFDNEAFRFLACVKKGIQFEEDEVRLYSQSWEQAYKTTHKLFEAVENFVPHNIRETISLNEARNCILALAKPMGEAIKLIDMNLKRIAEIKDVCDNCDINIAEFQKALKFKGFESRKETIDHPKTVCTHSECIRRVAIGQSSVTDTIYVTECHQHCYLEGIPIETTNNPGLANCAAMSSGTCKSCGHSYKIHMHVTYVVHIEEKEYLSSETQAKIKDKQSLKEQQRQFIRELKKTSEEQKAEKEQIYKSAVRFGVFLKKNAMVAINDSFDDYMHMLIYDESSKERKLRDENKIKKLEQDRETYLQKKKLLEKTINDGLACEDDIITPEKIIEIRNNLKKLKHNGKHLNDSLAAVEIAKNKALAKSRRKPQRISSSSSPTKKKWYTNWYY